MDKKINKRRDNRKVKTMKRTLTLLLIIFQLFSTIVIYGRNYEKLYTIEKNKVYNRMWERVGYIERGKIYDKNWKCIGYIEEKRNDR